MPEASQTQLRVERWFKAKRQELLGSADLALDHPGLVGGHREFFLRSFLGEFLPQRLSADRGIIYNAHARTGECDAVIWDSHNFPRLAMLNHSSFFAESVVAAIELKSHYSTVELKSARERCATLRQISLGASSGAGKLQDELAELWGYVAAMTDGEAFDGMYFAEPRPAYVVVFLRGGSTVDVAGLLGDPELAHDECPDAITFVEEGIFLRRWIPDVDEWRGGEQGRVQLTRPGEAVLMALADELLRIISLRSFGTARLYDLGAYKPWDFDEEREELNFPIKRMPHGYTVTRAGPEGVDGPR